MELDSYFFSVKVSLHGNIHQTHREVALPVGEQSTIGTTQALERVQYYPHQCAVRGWMLLVWLARWLAGGGCAQY